MSTLPSRAICKCVMFAEKKQQHVKKGLHGNDQMGLKSDHGQRHSPRIASEYYSRTNTVSNFSSLFLHQIPFFCIHVTSIRIFFAWGYVCLFQLHVPQRSKNRASVAVKTGLHSIYDILTFSEFPLRCSPMGTSMAHGYAWLAISSE